jgi:heme A synthase
MMLKPVLIMLCLTVLTGLLGMLAANLVLRSELEPVMQTGALGLIAALFLTAMAVIVVMMDEQRQKARRGQ